MSALHRREEESFLNNITPHHLGMSQPLPEMEPWMKDLLDESAMASAPAQWDALDGEFLNPLAFDMIDNSGACSNGVHDIPYPASLPSGNVEGADVFPESNTVAHYPSTCATLSPETPLLDLYTSFDSSSSSVQSPGPAAAPADASLAVFDQVAAAFRDLARARAEADPRPVSQREKRRDASLALYLQRLRDTCNDAVAMLASEVPHEEDFAAQPAGEQLFHDLATFDDYFVPQQQQNASSATASISPFEPGTFSESPVSSGDVSVEVSSARCSRSPATPPPAPSSKRQRTTAGPVAGGVELVMDLNMNAATSLPRKHRPRTQAQRERYLAVRNQGACEKHKRQHKRCTCIDKVIETQPSIQDHVVKRSRADRVSPGFPSPSSSSQAPTQEVGMGRPHHSPQGFCPRGCEDGVCNCHDALDEVPWQFVQPATRQSLGSLTATSLRLFREQRLERFVPNSPSQRLSLSERVPRPLVSPDLQHRDEHQHVADGYLDTRALRARVSQNRAVNIDKSSDDRSSPSSRLTTQPLSYIGGSPTMRLNEGWTQRSSRDLTGEAQNLQQTGVPGHRLASPDDRHVQASSIHSSPVQSALQSRDGRPNIHSGTLPPDRTTTPPDIPCLSSPSGRHKPSLAVIEKSERRLATLLPLSTTRSSSQSARSPSPTPPRPSTTVVVSTPSGSSPINIGSLQALTSCVLNVLIPASLRSCGQEWGNSPIFWLATWGLMLLLSAAMR